MLSELLIIVLILVGVIIIAAAVGASIGVFLGLIRLAIGICWDVIRDFWLLGLAIIHLFRPRRFPDVPLEANRPARYYRKRRHSIRTLPR